MKSLFVILSFLVLSHVHSQEFRSRLSKDHILIGEPVKLKYSARIPAHSKISYEPLSKVFTGSEKISDGKLKGNSIEFEVLETLKDTVDKTGEYWEWTGSYEITAWDSGLYIIPQSQIYINDSAFNFPPVLLRIDLSAPIPNQGLYDIKEGFAEVPVRNTFILWLRDNWYYLLVLLVLFVFLVIVIRKRRKKVPTINREMSLKERTLIALDALEKEGLWEKGKMKEHFTELSYIMRSYLSSRYELNLLEKTTYEAKLLLKQKGLHDETIKTLHLILSQADMVKFAQSTPDFSNVLRIHALARQIIVETSPIEIEHVE